jgi:hypothetical protein
VGTVDRLKKFGSLFGAEPRKDTAPEGGVERRAGKRIRLPLTVRFTLKDGTSHDGKLHEVNLRGLSVEPAATAEVGALVNIGFDGYPGVCDAFSLVGNVRQIMTDEESGEPLAMGIEIDRKSTTPEELQSYRNLVRHYLHHRPLLDGVNKGYFEGRCPSCNWLGRVGRRNPVCSRCGTRVELVQGEGD